MTHTKHTWAAAPSSDAVYTLARFENLADQYIDLKIDVGIVAGSRIVATPTSFKKASANYVTDGTHDEVQIQAAIDDCAANGGGSVILLEGTYTLGGNVRLKSNVNITGLGISTIISMSSYAIINDDTTHGNVGITIRMLNLTSTTGKFTLANCRDMPPISIQHVWFSTCGVLLTDCDSIAFVDCAFATSVTLYNACYNCMNISYTGSMFYHAGLYLSGCKMCRIQNNKFVFEGTTAWVLLNICSDCIFVSNVIRTPSSTSCLDGIVAYSGARNIIVNNSFTNFNYAAIYIYANETASLIVGNVIYGGVNDGTGYGGTGIRIANLAKYCNITGNYIGLNYSMGIWAVDNDVFTIQYGVVANNIVRDSGYHGMLLAGVVQTAIVGNMIRWNSKLADHTYHGIYIGGVSDTGKSLIMSNMIHKGDSAPQQYCGIYVDVLANYCLVSMNYLVDAGSTPLCDAAANTDKTAWMAEGNKI